MSSVVANWPTGWVSVEEADVLERWKGSRAKVWEYVVSHGQFLLRLSRLEDGVATSCYLFCKGCDRVEFDEGWPNSAIQVTLKHRERDRKQYTVTDGLHLRVECSALFVLETDK